ncbi:GATA transcription factor 11 isoform X2 [Hevea brasiliensis]|uniref:GATA transcription factor 11 isoform X2 n=1 Tax=Hevea brasiliensis TaxID=3981 RepID=UPI0025E73DC6|nr:GATA transcription factor 11 isoform X2 [Hevea brasiliensis]
MNGSWFFDENFNGVPDDFFDDAIKFLDFPLEDVEPNVVEDWEAKFQQLVPPPSNVLAGLTAGLYGENSSDILKVKKSSSVLPKQWPTATEASSSRSIPLNYNSSEVKYSHLFWTSSPVSVLESSSSSSSAENAMVYHPKFIIPVKRPRSKRPRPQRRTFSFMSTSYSPKQYHPMSSSESESESETYPDEKMLNLAKKKQKKKNLRLLSCTVEMVKPCSQEPVEIRKCSHCEVTKTPQWREGPMGPKTLCNACGVRYRSGRLFPEYRPAASPTFVPSLHSNSHRKVIEMRKKVSTTAATDTSLPVAPEHSF